MKTLIFTDLDGTLLDHKTYSYEKATQALQLCKNKNIPLIFTTSKTKAEVEKLHQKMALFEPMIVENGAAIFIPKNYQGCKTHFLENFNKDFTVSILGKKYEQILQFYNAYKDELKMVGFSDMNIQEIIHYTGLAKEDAILAKRRDFTEPFILQDISQYERLVSLASEHNIKITKGGRFYHLIGIDQDKGIAVQKAVKIFEKLYNTNVRSIGLGDGQNDIAMLQVVDIPINIQNHQGKYLQCDIKNLQKSSYKSSEGFNEMVLKNVQ